MGNQQANDHNLSITSQQRDDWIKLQDQGYCELWANKRTNKQFQAYPISEATAKDNVQIEKYAFRKMHSSFLVAAEAVISQNQAFLCTVPSTSFVLIQNIVNRLKSYQNALTFEEALYVLSSSASGYNTLCSFFGPLEPNEDMICFNESGNVKVWLNENFSKNEASLNARSMELEMPKMDDINFAERRSRQCVQKLMKIVEKSCVQPLPRAFKEQTQKLSTFFEISNFVDYFCLQNNIRILDHIQLRKTSQTNVLNSVGAVPFRAQLPASLQSSRVNHVFQSNFNQRQALSPVFVHQNQHFIPKVQFRPLFSAPVSVPRIQNHQVSYIVSAPVQSHIVVPPKIVITPTIPPPVLTMQIHTIVKRTDIAQECIQKSSIERAKSQLIHQQIEPVQQRRAQIVLTPEKHQKIVHHEADSLDKKQISEDYEDYEEKAQFNQEQIDFQHHQSQAYNHNNQHYIENHQEEAQPYQSQTVQQIQQNEYYETYQQERELNAESVYSNIEQYIAPQQRAFIESIEENREEEIISPKKQSEIDEWSQKLDNFTNSKSKNSQIHKIQVPKIQQNEIIVENKQPESFKNLNVSDKNEEYVNQLVNLEKDDIESYIRMKYQSYLKERAQPETQSNDIQYRRQSQQEEHYRPKYESYRSNQYQIEQQTAYNEYYPKISYQYQNQYAYQTSSIPSNNNRVSIEKEFHQDYTSSQRNYESSNYAYRHQNQDSYANQYQKQYQPKLRDSQRRTSNRTSNIIQEKYSKYVLNSQKPKRPTYNSNSEDVSLILAAEQSNFIKQTPKPIPEKSFDHDSFSNNRPSVNKGITYEKLRNLLRED